MRDSVAKEILSEIYSQVSDGNFVALELPVSSCETSYAIQKLKKAEFIREVGTRQHPGRHNKPAKLWQLTDRAHRAAQREGLA